MIAENLRELVPEAEVAIAHGQMPEERLEKVMNDFTRGRVDVLVCTTIIESGLDLPNANTLIVNRADKFGLTQLYQLRGRVGRGTNLAYAYFLYDRGRRLAPVAHQRLRTIYEATELGAGFGIAMKDLEIRGAGTLLGPRQSGHITAIGFSLYTRLLAEAVEEQKALREGKPKPPPKLPAPTVDLPLDAFIPEDYVTDVETRLELYKKLADVATAEHLDDVLKEYTDRFGTPPAEVDNLFYALRIKALAAQAGIESISTEEGQIVLRRFEGIPFDTQKFMGALTDGVTVGRTQIRIDYKRLRRKWKGVLEGVIRGLVK
jgi:transcription-repair coupling factor (superfamily II helicase)